jgi:succinoglycan biosynthesis transport protein ExoP
MSEDKPVHVPRERYPEIVYPNDSMVAPLDAEHFNPTVHLRDYWNVIVSRRWTIIAILITVVTITMVATFQQPPIYRAETTIQIDRENQNILSFKDVYEIESVSDDALQTQYKVLASRSLARRVIEELKLSKSPEFAPEPANFRSSVVSSIKSFLPSSAASVASTEKADPLKRVIDVYEAKLFVTPVTRSRLVRVAFEAKDPGLAARVINEHAKQFNLQNLQFKYDATQDATDFLSQQITGLKSALEKSEDTLQQYSRDNQILFTEEGKNTATEKLRQLEEAYTRVQADRIDKQALDTQIRTGHSDTLPQLLTNTLISQLSAQASDLRRQDAEAAVKYAEDYPSRLRLRGQIAQLDKAIDNERARVVRSVQSEFQAAEERERLLLEQLNQQTATVNHINEQIIRYSILKREVDSNKQLYDGLLTRLKEAGVSAGLRASNIRVVDRAEVPGKPVKPQKELNVLLSILAGLVIGVGTAFFQEYLDNTIKSPEDIARTLKLPTLAIIPKRNSLGKGYGYRYAYASGGPADKKNGGSVTAVAEPDMKDVPLEKVIHFSPSSLLAEAYRSLRTSLLLSAADHPPKSVLVTSSVPSEGKTATSVNLAISLTQSGGRVLLIDGDMRKPRIHTVFALQDVPGLSAFLTGSATLQEVIHDTEVSNLFVIPCGAIPPNPAELILSDRFQRMMDAVRPYFDHIIIDSPPLSNVSDARVLANACEGSLMVVKASSTSRSIAKKAVEHLAGSRARLVGAVLNDVDARSKSGDYSYSYYSGYGRYGYGR